jgi:hypothetical protein
MIRAGVDVVRLNFSHGKAQDHIDRATWCARRLPNAAAKWRSWRTCKVRRSASASLKMARSAGERRQVHPRRQVGRQRRTGQPGPRRPRLQGLAARSCARRQAAAERRPDRAGGRQVSRPRDPHHRQNRRRAVQQQGHQPPGWRPDRAGADRQGHGRHQDGDEFPGRLPGDLLPEKRDRHGNGAPAGQYRRRAVQPQAADDRQDRARRSDSRAAGNPRRLRRHHGRARRPGGGSGQCRGAGAAKAHDPHGARPRTSWPSPRRR